MIAHAGPGGLDDTDRALATLIAGTRFLAEHAARPRLSAPWPLAGADQVRSRYLGNCLAELDRFLHVLMDALAPALRLAAQPGQRNTANKLRALGVTGIPLDPAADRLRALGRSRDCLRHCRGTVRRADAPADGWMTTGWIDPGTDALARYRLGEQLTPGRVEIVGMCDFYAGLGNELATLGSHSARPA